MAKIRLSAHAGLPSRCYHNGPVHVTVDGWTEHELTKELGAVLVGFAPGRIIVHQDDAKQLASIGLELVDNEIKPIDKKPKGEAKTEVKGDAK